MKLRKDDQIQLLLEAYTCMANAYETANGAIFNDPANGVSKEQLQKEARAICRDAVNRMRRSRGLPSIEALSIRDTWGKGTESEINMGARGLWNDLADPIKAMLIIYGLAGGLGWTLFIFAEWYAGVYPNPGP